MKHNQDPIYRELITSRKWRELRINKLISQPLCERCKATGILTWATEVHHIRPIESVKGRAAMTSLAFSINNLQSLCHACHVQAHKELERLTRETQEERTKKAVDAFEERFLKE